MSFEPTIEPDGKVTVCFVCGRHAASGVGIFKPGGGDPGFLCDLCVPLLNQLRSTTAFSRYEQIAIDRTVDGVGPLIERFGFDLSTWDADQIDQFLKEVILTFSASVRDVIRTSEVPF